MKNKIPEAIEFSKGLYVELKENESCDRLIKRFMRKVKESRILDEYVEKTSYYMTPRKKKKIKKAKSMRRKKQ